MPFTVLSRGVLCEAEFLFEKLTKHEDNDSFIFILGYNHIKYRVYVYGDYSYMVILPTQLTESWFHIYEQLLGAVEILITNFLSWCRHTVNRNHIYNCEQEIGYYLLRTFGIYVSDWNIWYAVFSLPYQRFKVKELTVSDSDDLCAFFPTFKIVNTT